MDLKFNYNESVPLHCHLLSFANPSAPYDVMFKQLADLLTLLFLAAWAAEDLERFTRLDTRQQERNMPPSIKS